MYSQWEVEPLCTQSFFISGLLLPFNPTVADFSSPAPCKPAVHCPLGPRCSEACCRPSSQIFNLPPNCQS